MSDTKKKERDRNETEWKRDSRKKIEMRQNGKEMGKRERALRQNVRDRRKREK